MSLNSFNTRQTLTVGHDALDYFSLPALEAGGFPAVSRLPFSLKILLENLLRREDNAFVKAVKATGRKQLIIAGVVTEVCVAFPALSALAEDFEVFVVSDASGTFGA